MVEYRRDPMARHLDPIAREARLHVSAYLRHRSLDRRFMRLPQFVVGYAGMPRR